MWVPAVIGGVSAMASSFLSSKSGRNKETKMQKTQRKLVDQLLQSLYGQGPMSDLYNFDQDIFNKSFVEPAQAKFRNQIAPQIQQKFIAGGQQRSTGLQDTLTRAGVDLDSEINKYMYQAQQDALNRKQGTINSILSMGAGAPAQQSTGEALASGASGYLSSEGFQNSVADIYQNYNNPNRGGQNQRQRPGYAYD